MRVLVVDDDADYREIIQRFISRRGHAVVCVRSALHALHALRFQEVDVLLTDEGMAFGGSGALLLESARSLLPGLPMALVAGAPSAEAILRAYAIDAEVIVKSEPQRILEFLNYVESRSRAFGRGGDSSRSSPDS